MKRCTKHKNIDTKNASDEVLHDILRCIDCIEYHIDIQVIKRLAQFMIQLDNAKKNSKRSKKVSR